jgi:glycosyltransferase involved in cell wall biosynthesis
MKYEAPTGQKLPRVTCIVPAYNEQERIAAVVSTVARHPLIAEVIVVDDGSTDETALVAGRVEGVVVHRLRRNGGKSRAVGVGLSRATGEYILLVDADLVGLSASDLTQLVAPVLRGDADMSISLRRNAPWLWRRIGIDYISGERVFPAGLIMDRMAEMRELPRFGFEVWLNGICIDAHCRIAVVPWHGVASPIKIRKHGLSRGIVADIDMLSDLFRCASAWQLLRQIMSMRRQRVRSGQAIGHVALRVRSD